MLSLLFLLTGFLLLWKGADTLIVGSTRISKIFKIPDVVAGLTLLAFGTSAPELFVNLFAAAQGKPDIIFGNILGSNIANILLILGVTSLLCPLVFKKQYLFQELPLSIGAMLALVGILLYSGHLGFVGAIILLSGFIAFLSFLFFHPELAEFEDMDEQRDSSLFKALLIFLVGLLMLPLGAKLVIDSAIHLSALLSIPESIVSLFAVALGTSLPELATSISAALKKKPDMVIGNILGSNIFNVLFVLGLCGLWGPLTFNVMLWPDLMLAIGVSLSLFILVYWGRNYWLSKVQGGILFVIYLIYIVSLYFRG